MIINVFSHMIILLEGAPLDQVLNSLVNMIQI